MQSVRVVQERWLMECLGRNAGCEYGRTYGFEHIANAADYRRAVPLVNYEDISPLIEQIAGGSNDILCMGEPVAFEVTGGSTGGGKLIPYTPESFADFQKALLPWFTHTLHHYGIGSGSSYWSISPAMRTVDTTPRGIDIGVSDAAYLGEAALGSVAEGMAVPLWVVELHELDEWQIATLYHLIRADDLELLSVWSPTFLLMLLDALEEQSGALRGLLSDGGTVGGHSLAADPEALTRLQKYLKNTDTAQLWPNLKLISCWEDAMSRPYAKRLKERFRGVPLQPKGLISTEGVVTVPDIDGIPLLSIESGFYEFIDSTGTLFLADELQPNEIYEVVMTTNGGLYRYRCGDTVRYEGSRDGVPILRFMGRSGNTSDMVGEKLTEAFVLQALRGMAGSAMLVAQPGERPNYLLLGESESIGSMLEEVEQELMRNPQYAYARKMGQLEKVETIIVPGLMRLYIGYKNETGNRVGDIKVPALSTDGEWLKRIKRETP